MPLSRVAIAAVFVVVGLLIIVPMLNGSSSGSRVTDSSHSAHVSASPNASPTAGASATPSHRPSHRPSHTPSHRPSATHTTRRATVAPVQPSITPETPLSVAIGGVLCPGRGVRVTVTNHASQAEDYAILTDGSITVADRIPAGASRRSTVNVREDHTTTIAVTWNNVPVKSVDRHANCVGAHRTSTRALPHTGPDRGMIIARVATGLAVIVTGCIVFWYGRLWPGRRDKMFD
jgi:hypothetical protein